MKWTFYLIALLTLPSLLSAKNLNHFFGEFHSADHRYTFDIRSSGNKLQVYDVYFGDHETYRYVGNNTYQSRNGHMIKVLNRDQILFRLWRCRRVVKLYLHNQCGLDNHYRDHTNSREYPEQDRWNDEYEDRTGDIEDVPRRRPNDTDPMRTEQSPPSIKSLEGTWESDRPRKSVVILYTREGLKAKFSGTTKWVDFIQDDFNASTYKDKNGNRYEVNGNDLVWISQNGTDRVFLRKISDDLKF